MKRSYSKRTVPYGGPQHRIAKAPPREGVKIDLLPSHPALVNATTIFPKSVVPAAQSPRLLVSGMNSRKTGRMVTVGRWKGCPIFTLTLVERETCPRSCENWRTCYGNNMHWSRRHRPGPGFEAKLWAELSALNAKHPHGFVVRLHILGDFYSTEYVDLWLRALDELPALRVFGYTSRDAASRSAWPCST